MQQRDTKPSGEAPTGALSGVKILDLSRILAGPWACQTLADLGAEVIKIERPGIGDDTRSWGPPYVTDAKGNQGSSAYFNSANRGKESVAVDITTPEGSDLVRRLAAECDIFIENFKVGGLEKYGLDYASLAAVNPSLIYCSITGFGQTGPYAARAGYDFLVQGMGGLMSITGQPDGAPGAEPMKVGVALADVLTGLYATIGILAALRHRDVTGEGQHIDIGLLDVQVAALANQAMNYLATGQSPIRLGNAHPSIVPYQAFPTSDGHIILAIGNDGQFRRFCQVAERTDICDDARFATNPHRVRNRDELVPLLRGILVEKPLDWWLDVLAEAGVPAGPINTLDRVFANPQVIARDMVIEAPDAAGEPVRMVGSPIKMSATPPAYPSAAPQLGQHTRQVLTRVLGMSGDALDGLEQQGTIESPGGGS